MNGKFLRNGIVMLVLVVGTVALLYTFLISSPTDQSVAYSQFLSEVQKGNVKDVQQQDLRLTVTGKDGKDYVVVVPGVGFTDVYGDVQKAARPAGSSRAVHLSGRRRRKTGQWVCLLIARCSRSS